MTTNKAVTRTYLELACTKAKKDLIRAQEELDAFDGKQVSNAKAYLKPTKLWIKEVFRGLTLSRVDACIDSEFDGSCIIKAVLEGSKKGNLSHRTLFATADIPLADYNKDKVPSKAVEVEVTVREEVRGADVSLETEFGYLEYKPRAKNPGKQVEAFVSWFNNVNSPAD